MIDVLLVIYFSDVHHHFSQIAELQINLPTPRRKNRRQACCHQRA